MKPALLVIDVQKSFFTESEVQTRSLQSAVNQIVPAVQIFHELKLPVVFVQHKDEAEGLVPGTEGFNLPDEFIIQADDLRITKTYGNALNKTGLEKQLKALGVDTLILTGFCAEHCVLSTYRGAEDVDLKPILLLGSLASGSIENLHFVERLCQMITLQALQVLIR